MGKGGFWAKQAFSRCLPTFHPVLPRSSKSPGVKSRDGKNSGMTQETKICVQCL